MPRRLHRVNQPEPRADRLDRDRRPPGKFLEETPEKTSAVLHSNRPVYQTFGDRINFHPHLHFLVTEGGVDESGVFHTISRIDDSRLAQFFAREVLASLVHKELLSPE